MKKKNGFTLVELLAVIVILAVILVIAMPKISEVIKKTRLSSLEATAKLLINQAEKKYTENQVLDNSSAIKCSDVAKLNENDYGTCNITFDNNGNASVILNGKKNGKFDNLTCSGTKGNITCSEGQTEITLKCVTGKSSLTQGDEYVNGQYTYKYMQEIRYDDTWDDIYLGDGWGVALTDKNSTAPVTTILCSSIDDKPIVSMSNMFANSQATSIDLLGFDTTKVENMKEMFLNVNVPTLDLSSFETPMLSNMSDMFAASNVANIIFGDMFDISHVRDMVRAFNGIETENLDLSKIKTQYNSISSMRSMFLESKITTLNMSGFDASNVTDMSEMFYLSQIDNLDLTNIKTNNVTNMYRMFSSSHISNIIGLTSLDTSNVTNMSCMFGDMYSTSSFSSIDVSDFDTSNVTDMSYMFAGFGGAIDGIIGVEKFNTSNVENMEGMFSYTYNANKEDFVLDLSNYNTSKVTNMSKMFRNTGPRSIKFGVQFDTSNVTNMEEMFSDIFLIDALDLSNFDTSNVTNMNNMLNIYIEDAIPAYAKTCEDAARLNASSGKSSNVTFTVKDTTC